MILFAADIDTYIFQYISVSTQVIYLSFTTNDYISIGDRCKNKIKQGIINVGQLSAYSLDPPSPNFFRTPFTQIDFKRRFISASYRRSDLTMSFMGGFMWG